MNATNAAKTRYNRRNYDQVKIYVTKGGREAIQAAAEDRGYSMAEYIRHLIIADTRADRPDMPQILGGGGGNICQN